MFDFTFYVDGWDVRELRFEELRCLCQQLELPHNGSRAVLQARLLEYKQFPSRFVGAA